MSVADATCASVFPLAQDRPVLTILRGEIVVTHNGGPDNACRLSGDDGVGGDILGHGRSGAYDGVVTDFYLRDNAGADAYHRPPTKLDIAGKHCARANCRVIADLDVMADAGAPVDERKASDAGRCADNGAGVDKRAVAERGRARDNGGGVDQSEAAAETMPLCIVDGEAAPPGREDRNDERHGQEVFGDFVGKVGRDRRNRIDWTLDVLDRAFDR